MITAPDFTDEEMNTIRVAVENRWKNEMVELHPADVGTKLSAYSNELTECPAIFWAHEHCNFILVKTGDNRYRCQFFYTPHDQFGTGINEYSEISEAVTSLLRVQADHEGMTHGDIPG